MTTHSPILRVAIDTPLRKLFDYLPPPQASRDTGWVPGARVRVPFGRRRLVGILVEVADASTLPPEKLRPAIEMLDAEPAMPVDVVALAKWAADYYQHAIGEVIAAALPGPIRDGAALIERAERWELTDEGHAAIRAAQQPKSASDESRDMPRPRLGPRQRTLLELLQAGSAAPGILERIGDRWRDILRGALAKGWVQESAPTPANPTWTGEIAGPGPALTPAQAEAVEQVVAAPNAFHTWLLHGVTGSGKTEVYLRIVERVLASQRQALVLVPEITLTPQLVGRFEKRFKAPLAVFHSGLTEVQRATAWRRARSGDAAIVIGTRSAVFAPLARPGVFIVDEEHDSSYKQQDGFRYSARDLAIVRAQRAGVPVVLGSATPSLESIENARQGRFTRLSLPERAGSARHPRLMLVDLRRENVESGLAGTAVFAIERHLDAGGQVLVYLNRRGYAPTLFCPGCGWMAPCRNCDARMTVHLKSRRLECHHCGAHDRLPLGCPKCGHEVKPLGQGTERVEDVLRDRFPHAPLLRFDRDVVRHRGELESMLGRVTAGEARLLVGTQMLTKGHDFPDVTLVVIVHADQGLFSADFRASERLAQTIVQVSGRAGRASRPGEVLIQTEFPEHPLLRSLLDRGYDGFAEAALDERKAASWPPFSRLALLRADAPKLETALQFLLDARTAGEPVADGVELLGPVPATMARRAGRFNAQLLAQSASRVHLQRFLSSWIGGLEGTRRDSRVHWSVDVDPNDLY